MPSPIRSRRSLVAVALLVVALAAAGCGVPWSSGVITDRSANNSGTGLGNTIQPLGPDGLKDPATYVEKYLESLAGHTESDQKTATAFMADSAKATWQAGRQIRVIRPIGRPAVTGYATAGSKYNAMFAVLGVFSPADGTLTPAPGPQTVNLTFDMTPVLNDQGQIQRLQFVGKMQDGMFLSEEGLTKYYRAQDVYFWDTNKDRLISELRHAPLTVTPLQRDTMITNWVLAGPSDALGAAAKSVVNATLLDPLVTEVDDRVVVDLAPTRSFSPADGLKLADQLRWSLSGLETGNVRVVQLQVDRQDQLPPDQSVTDDNNPFSVNNQPRTFAIGNGVVHALSDPQPAILNVPQNKDVKAAAVSSDGNTAALVRHLKGEDELWVRADPKSQFKMVDHGASIGRPNMIANPSVMVAVVVDGELHLVDAAKGRARTIAVPALPDIKTMSVAPDDRRFVFVSSDGHLFTSNLIWQSGSPSMTQARPLWPSVSRANAVDWSGPGKLVIASTIAKEDHIYEINSDGTNAHELGSATTVSTLSAYPYNPISPEKNSVLYQTTNESHRVPEQTPLTWANSNAGWGTPLAPFFAD